jgi:hypothetical protein
MAPNTTASAKAAHSTCEANAPMSIACMGGL